MKNRPSAAGKFTSKNRNKRVDPNKRYKMYATKQSKKEFNGKVVDRENLQKFSMQEVEVSGELTVYNRKDPLAPSLVQHVYVNDEYVDHIWINFSIKDRKKLKLHIDGNRVLFTAVVVEYTKTVGEEIRVKYGLREVKLK